MADTPRDEAKDSDHVPASAMATAAAAVAHAGGDAAAIAAEPAAAAAAAPAKPTHASSKDGTVKVAVASRLDLYEVMKPIGKGKFSTVFRARRKADGMVVALKQIRIFDIMDENSREKCLKEIRLVQSLDHPNIIKYLDSFIENDQLHLVFEYAEAGDLKRQLRKAREREARFDERIIWKYFSQIAKALRHMHERRVMHRDLKPANVFLTLNGTVKVGDLGLGRHFSEATMEAYSKVGTPLYMSPEVLKGKGYEWKSDVWSLGCVLYELAKLRSPFKEQGLDLYGLFKKITKGTYPPISEVYSSTLRNLADRMLSTDPANRPDMGEICAIAQHMRDQTARARAQQLAARQMQMQQAQQAQQQQAQQSHPQQHPQSGQQPQQPRHQDAPEYKHREHVADSKADGKQAPSGEQEPQATAPHHEPTPPRQRLRGTDERGRRPSHGRPRKLNYDGQPHDRAGATTNSHGAANGGTEPRRGDGGGEREDEAAALAAAQAAAKQRALEQHGAGAHERAAAHALAAERRAKLAAAGMGTGSPPRTRPHGDEDDVGMASRELEDIDRANAARTGRQRQHQQRAAQRPVQPASGVRAGSADSDADATGGNGRRRRAPNSDLQVATGGAEFGADGERLRTPIAKRSSPSPAHRTDDDVAVAAAIRHDQARRRLGSRRSSFRRHRELQPAEPAVNLDGDDGTGGNGGTPSRLQQERRPTRPNGPSPNKIAATNNAATAAATSTTTNNPRSVAPTYRAAAPMSRASVAGTVFSRRAAPSTSLPVSNSAGITICSDAVELLSLLDYESLFAEPRDMLPFSRCHFACQLATRGGSGSAPTSYQQFDDFMAITEWLLQQLDASFQYTSRDGPTVAQATEVLAAVQRVGGPPCAEQIVGVTPHGLMKGHGPGVGTVIRCLAEQVLLRRHWAWAPPDHSAEDDDVDVAEVDESMDMGGGDAQGADSGVEEEEEVMFMDIAAGGVTEEDVDEDAAPIEAQVDPLEWAAECERVKLRLRHGTGNLATASQETPWRTHLTQLRRHATVVEVVGHQAGRDVERVRSSEARINGTRAMADMAQQYREAAQAAKQYTQELQELQERVNAKSSELAGVADAVADVREQLDSRGGVMTDSAPLQRMRAALARLRKESKTMDVRLGAMRYEVDRARMKMWRDNKRRRRLKERGNADLSSSSVFSDDDSSAFR